MKYVFIAVFLSLSINSFCQKQRSNNKLPPPPPTKYSEKDYAKMVSCAYKQRIAPNLLLKQSPFDKSRQVKLVSFANFVSYDSAKRVGSYSSLIREYKYNEKKQAYDSTIVDTVKWKEEKILNQQQTQKLADLLFNFGFYNPEITMESESSCYSPQMQFYFMMTREILIA